MLGRERVLDARHVDRLLAAARGGPPRTMLELGSGGGNLASHLRVPELTLTDISPQMLAISRSQVPRGKRPRVCGSCSTRVGPPGSTTYLSDFVFLLREPGGGSCIHST